MKRFIFSLSVLFTTLICCSTAFAQDDKTPQANPVFLEFNFEDGTPGEPPRKWIVAKTKGLNAQIFEEAPETGERCVRFIKNTDQLPFGAFNYFLRPGELRGKRIRIRADVRADVSGKNQAMLWFRENLKSGSIGMFDNMHDRPIKLNEWKQYEIVSDVSNDANSITFGVLIVGKGEVFIDNVVVQVVDESVKPTARLRGTARSTPVSPGLFEINGSMEVRASQRRLKRGAESNNEARLLLPLPLVYGSQIPLTYNLTADPPEALKSVVIYEDNPNNFVAEVILSDLPQHKKVELKFNSAILVLPTSFKDVPSTAVVPDHWPDEASPWLEATWCVDSENDRIKSIGDEIRGETDDVLKIIKQVEMRARAIYQSADGRVKNLTAVEALDKKGSCTSCGNLVAALLRASDVPARVLAGYPSWSGPLQTHYIVEAYVPGYGWYPIESTMLQSPWPNKNQVNVSIIPPEYESRKLAGRRGNVAGGVPYLTLTESPENNGQFFTVGTIPGKKYCDHECKFIRKFECKANQWDAAAAWAVPRWKEWLNSEPSIKNGKFQFGPLAEKLEASDPRQLKLQLDAAQ